MPFRCRIPHRITPQTVYDSNTAFLIILDLVEKNGMSLAEAVHMLKTGAFRMAIRPRSLIRISPVEKQ